MNVVLIEDDEATALLMSFLLCVAPNVNLTVVTKDIAKAIAETPWEDVDAVIADHWLGDMDGSKILAWITEHFPSIRRIMVTANPAVVDQVEWADVVFIKPVAVEQLYEALGVKNE